MAEEFLKRDFNRIFTFGCSFTGYAWMTWPEVLSYEFDLPLYNYGRSGAGNQYIFNTLIQALTKYNIGEKDLVIVQFTNICREDRYLRGNWITPGNIFSHQFYDKSYTQRYSDITGYLLRDLATITSVDKLLQANGCKYIFFSMNKLTEYFNQFSNEKIEKNVKNDAIQSLYSGTLCKILPSFYEVLWGNDITFKIKQERELFGSNYADAHPSPIEHLKFLELSINVAFSQKTVNAVKHVNDRWLVNSQKLSDEGVKGVYLLPKDRLIQFTTECRLVKGEPIFLL